MKVVLQRVSSASIDADGKPVGAIGAGLCLYVGVAVGDGEESAKRLAKKISELRIFEDEAGKMNLSAVSVGAEILSVSNFTLCADCVHGHRPSFAGFSERPERAQVLYEVFCKALEECGLRVVRGVFGADMRIRQVNEGPVTIVLDAGDISR